MLIFTQIYRYKEAKVLKFMIYSSKMRKSELYSIRQVMMETYVDFELANNKNINNLVA